MKRLSELAGAFPERDRFRVGEASQFSWMKKERKTVHLYALGDVGGTLLMGLKLLGGEGL